MDEAFKREWEAERKLNTEVDKLTRVAEEVGTKFLPSGDLASDCSGDYVTQTLMDWCTNGYGAQLGSEEELRAHAEQFARRYADRRRAQRRHERLECETPGFAQLVSRDPGPEEIVQCADLLARLLEPLPHLLPTQQTLFVRRVLDEANLVELAIETGRSADALCKAMRRTLDHLRKILAGDAFDENEVKDFLSLLDQYRNDA